MLGKDKTVEWWVFPAVILVGAFFGLLFEVLVSPINALGLRLGSMQLIYVAMMVLGFDLFLGIGSYMRLLIFGFLIGGAALAVGSYFATGGETIARTSSLSKFSILFLVVILLILSLTGILGKGWTSSPILPRATSKWRWGGALILLTGFLIYRVSQAVLRSIGVPNELRSFVIGTVEVHHLITGLMLLTFLIPLSHHPLLKNTRGSVLRFLLAVALGLIADQVSYLAVPQVSDETYFSTVSIAGGILATTCGMLWFLLRQRGNTHAGRPK